MLKLNDIEFYNTPSGGVMVSVEGQEAFILLPTHYDLISILHDYIMQNYHGAYLALSSLYKGSAQNPSYYRYRIVSRFARCNFGEYETNVVDISKHTFHFEQVHCPLRGAGDCQLEKVVCNPQYTLPLTRQQINIFRMYADGLNTEQIAKKLSLSTNTIDRHRSDIQSKLDLHSITEMILFWINNNLK